MKRLSYSLLWPLGSCAAISMKFCLMPKKLVETKPISGEWKTSEKPLQNVTFVILTSRVFHLPGTTNVKEPTTLKKDLIGHLLMMSVSLCLNIYMFIMSHVAFLITYRLLSRWVRRMVGGARRKKKRRFFFEEHWTTNEDCNDVIRNAWGCATNGIQNKLNGCAESLVAWNRDVFGHIPSKLRRANAQLE